MSAYKFIRGGYRRFGAAAILLLAVLLLSGTPWYLNARAEGVVPRGYGRFYVAMPAFASLLVMGFAGFYVVIRWGGRSVAAGLVGFAVVILCYGGIEVLFWWSGGR